MNIFIILATIAGLVVLISIADSLVQIRHTHKQDCDRRHGFYQHILADTRVLIQVIRNR